MVSAYLHMITNKNGQLLRHAYYMVHMEFIGLYVTLYTFSQKWDKHTILYTWGGYTCVLPYAHLLINETYLIYGNTKNGYSRVILYE